MFVAHKHWAAFLPEALAATAPILILVVFLLISGTTAGSGMHVFFALLVPLGLLITWIAFMVLWTNYYLDMLILTDRRLFYTTQASLINRITQEWDIRDIQQVNVGIANVLESFFNYGSLYLRARGEMEAVSITGMPDPSYIAAVILKQDDRYGELKETTRKQQELLKFISHEIKGHLTKSKAAFAAIVEGDYGPVPQSLDSMAHSELADSQKGVDTVMSILQGSDLEHGTTSIEKKPLDLSTSVRRVVQDFRFDAAQKRIELIASVDDFCAVIGDIQKLEKHVVRNLIDNALRYTPAGRIEVKLAKRGGMVRLSVADTGVGIAAKDMASLFTQGGKGVESKSINPESTGYGLFIAKQIVETHGGRIWAHSSGPGTGSTFFVELPSP